MCSESTAHCYTDLGAAQLTHRCRLGTGLYLSNLRLHNSALKRLYDIVERWQANEVGDPEAVRALKAVEGELLDVEAEAEAEEQGMDDAEFAIYTHLTEETPEAIKSDDQAKTVAEEIASQFRERVDRGYNGWKTNQQTIAEIERILLDVLVKEHDLGHLIQGDDEFVDAVRDYLIQNHG